MEGALVTLGMVSMMIGVFEFSRAAFAYNQVQYVADIGARYAALRGSTATGRTVTTSDVSTYVKGLMIAIDSTQATVTTTWTPNNNPGGKVKVQVDYVFANVIPFVNSSITFRGASVYTVLE